MRLFSRLGIRAKLACLLGLMTLALVITVGFASSVAHDNMMADRVSKLKAIVENTYGMAQQFDNEVKAGKLTKEQAVEAVRTAIHGMKYDGGDGYIFFTLFNGVTLIHGANPKQEGDNRGDLKDVNGKPISGSMKIVAQTQGEGTTTYYYQRPGGTQAFPKLTYVKTFAPWDGYIGSGVYVDDIDAEFHALLWKLGGIAFVLLAVTGAIAFGITSSITGPLSSLKTKMARLATGDLKVDIVEVARADEIGEMAKTVQIFKDNAVEMQQLQAEQEGLKAQAEQEKKRAMAALADNFESRVRGIVDAVSGAATHMQSTARSMSETADSTRQQSLAVATGANEATNNVQTVAAASEELSASISEIGRQVGQASAVSKRAADEGQRTNESVSGLAEAAQKIGEVVALINDIASQTNLLALNATIEAARAGEAGKGFAVVASEVKSLANQTAKATDDIRAQITAIQAETRSAVDAIKSISKTVDEVSEISSSIAAAVEQQSAATQEITRNVQQAASGTQEVSHNIGTVNKSSEKAGENANEVLAAANDLTQQAQSLRQEVDQFLATVRAA